MTRGYRSWFEDLINVWAMPATMLKNKVMYGKLKMLYMFKTFVSLLSVHASYTAHFGDFLGTSHETRVSHLELTSALCIRVVICSQGASVVVQPFSLDRRLARRKLRQGSHCC
jgi:hypothetical protein